MRDVLDGLSGFEQIGGTAYAVLPQPLGRRLSTGAAQDA